MARRSSSSRTSSARPKGRGVQARPSRRNYWIFGAIGAMLLIGLIVALVVTSPPATIAGVTTFSDLSRDHQQGTVAYEQTPPVGGAHNPAWQNCGRYDQPIGSEYAVHSLEHGAVWITHQPELPADQIEQLRNLVRGRPYTLLSPYPNLPAPIFASAWGVQMQVDNASDPRLGQFLTKYIQGSQTPEPGALCTGGVGTPVNR